MGLGGVARNAWRLRGPHDGICNNAKVWGGGSRGEKARSGDSAWADHTPDVSKHAPSIYTLEYSTDLYLSV